MTDVVLTSLHPASDDSLGEDSMDEDSRPAERWAPLGAVASPEPGATSSDGEMERGDHGHASLAEMKRLEEDQEQLNSALFALTSHFGQVQFRLKQIVDADSSEKDKLLKELEEFAFRGIPDSNGLREKQAQLMKEISDIEHEAKIEEQRRKQLQLIEQLKSQLEELEQYAYETGEMDEPPTFRVVEKQKVVIDQLKHNLDLNLENLDRLSADELRHAVDTAISQIINPAKVKEKLVDQLKTQIVDLERFIEFLQGEFPATSLMQYQSPACRCSQICPIHGKAVNANGIHVCNSNNSSKKNGVSGSGAFLGDPMKEKHMRERTLGIMRRALTVLQLFAATQLGCGGEDFQRNILKRRAGPSSCEAQHWGDVRARLELAVEKVLAEAALIKAQARERRQLTSSTSSNIGEHGDLVAEELGEDVFDEEYHSDTEEYIVTEAHKELTQVVRKDLCPALRDLMGHGLMESAISRSLIPLGCFPSRSHRSELKVMHPWQLFLKFYSTKRGHEYNESPARKLSQSFDLDIVGGKAITTKQQLLSAIGTVLQSHAAYKRSDDSKLKALISVALNEKRLVHWLRLIVKNPMLVDYYYQPWSYTAKAGFDDALHCLNRLSTIDFKLPYDLAVRQFRNIKDAF